MDDYIQNPDSIIETHQETKGSLYIWEWLYYYKGLSFSAKFLLVLIYNLNNDCKGCYASNKYLAERVDISVRKTQEYIQKLEDLGFIRRVIENLPNGKSIRHIFTTEHVEKYTGTKYVPDFMKRQCKTTEQECGENVMEPYGHPSTTKWSSPHHQTVVPPPPNGRPNNIDYYNNKEYKKNSSISLEGGVGETSLKLNNECAFGVQQVHPEASSISLTGSNKEELSLVGEKENIAGANETPTKENIFLLDGASETPEDPTPPYPPLPSKPKKETKKYYEDLSIIPEEYKQSNEEHFDLGMRELLSLDVLKRMYSLGYRLEWGIDNFLKFHKWFFEFLQRAGYLDHANRAERDKVRLESMKWEAWWLNYKQQNPKKKLNPTLSLMNRFQKSKKGYPSKGY